MSNYLLLIYPLLLLAVTFGGCKINPKGEFSSDYWSRAQSQLLQGIFCVFVILHHLTQSVTTYGQIYKGPITILSSMGILFTAVFFFFSGYGLIYSYMNKPRYLGSFLSHRFPVILVPFFVSNIIYVLARIYITHIPTKGSTLYKCLTGLILLNGNGWYIVEIFILYLAFFFCFRFIRKKDISLILLSLFTILLIIKSLYNGHDYTEIGGHWFKGEWWYNSTITFIMGMLFARFRERVVNFIKAGYRILLPLTVILFIITFVIEEYVLRVYGYYHESLVVDGINDKVITLIAQSILCLIFVFLILLISLKITLGNRLLKGLSVISTELFLIHNLFLHGIFDFTHTKDFAIYGIVLVCSIPAATVMHFIDAPIIKFLQNLFSGKGKGRPDRQETERLQAQKEKRLHIIKSAIKIGLIVCVCLTFVLGLLNILIMRPYDYKKELRSLYNANPGDVVTLGRYEANYLIPGKEPLSWIVLDKQDNNLIMITEYGIDSSVYHDSHTETSWSNSYICDWLNTRLYNKIFNSYEKNIVTFSDESSYLTLLSVTEAMEYFENDYSRQLKITQAAEKKGTNVNYMSKVNYWDSKGYRSSWWWLKGNDASLTAPIVTVDGTVSENTKFVNKPYGAVRPVVRIHLPD